MDNFSNNAQTNIFRPHEVKPSSTTCYNSNQPNSYDSSYSTLSVAVEDVHRSRSYDDRYLQQTVERNYPHGPKLLKLKDILAPQKILDKESQDQIDEFEEVITRMASMTRGNQNIPSAGHLSCLNNKNDGVSDRVSDTLSPESQSCLQYNRGDRFSMSHDIRCATSTNSNRVSPRSVPYPPPVSSPSTNYEASQMGSRRHSVELVPRRTTANSQVKIQVNDCYMLESNYPVGLPPLAPPQSVKNISTSSRTQMKQQLMRQQLQEQEAKERKLQNQRALQKQQIDLQQRQSYQQHQQQHHNNQQHSNNLIYTSNQSYLQEPDSSALREPPQPIQIISQLTTTVPSQPLNVSSRLENPTKYHVVQTHKRALRQKLSDNKDEENDSSLEDITPVGDSAPNFAGVSSFTLSTSHTNKQYPCSDPGQTNFTYDPDLMGVVPQHPSVVVTEGLVGYSPQCSSIMNTNGRKTSSGSQNPAKAAKYSNSKIEDTRRKYSSASQDQGSTNNSFSANSFGSSTGVSLTSDASEVNDVIEEILNLEENLEAANSLKKCSSKSPVQQTQDEVPDPICDLLGLNGVMGNKTPTSCSSEVQKVKSEPQTGNDPQVVAFIKDRQKKDNHNMIERRRRFNINDRIKDLSRLLPKTNEPYHELVRDIRYNKGQILRASVDYIQRLKNDLERSKASEHARVALEQTNRQLVVRVRELENMLRNHGILVEETKIDQNLLLPTISQSDILSPTTSPFTPTSPTPQSTPVTSYESTPMTDPVPTTDLVDLCFPSTETTEPNPLFNPLVGFGESNDDPKKVRCSAPFQEIPWDEILDEFASTNFGLSLMEDDNLSFADDPMFSSPPVSSPNSSHHSFEDALTPESMDIVS